jgi:hypothetical protein
MIRRVVLILLLSGVTAAQAEQSARTQAFAALPDWSGMWESDDGLERGISGRPRNGFAEMLAKMPMLRPPPYNSEWRARYEAAARDPQLFAKAHVRKTCSGFGYPGVMDSVLQFALFTVPEATAMVFSSGEVRHIRTDGRAHPAPDDLWPTALGDSIGQWQGDTLVIDTIARSAGPVHPFAFIAELSEQARFTERIRKTGPDTMENQLTIDDPVAFTQPWKLTLKYRRVTDLDRLIVTPNFCTENDRNPVVNGEVTIAPP